MADKRLINVPLTELRTNDEEVIGSLYPHKGKIYRWVKNAGVTDLVATAPCLTLPDSDIDQINKRVVSPSAAGIETAASAAIRNIAGAAVAAITKSGSDTGDHGWIQVKGLKKVSMTQSATASDQYIGALAIATDQDDTNWARPISPTGTPSTVSIENVAVKKVMLVRLHTTTGAATAYSAYVDIQCL